MEKCLNYYQASSRGDLIRSILASQYQQDVFLCTKIILLLARMRARSAKTSELGFRFFLDFLQHTSGFKKTIMGRNPEKERDKLYNHLVQTRVTETVYNRLLGFVGTSDCHTISEVARRILSRERILYFSQDRSLDPIVEELIVLRRELNAIGHNVNQVTHYFHMADNASQKTFHALKIAEQYNAVSQKVDHLNKLISSVSKKWLQK